MRGASGQGRKAEADGKKENGASHVGLDARFAGMFEVISLS
jgi:hypothetical protein